MPIQILLILFDRILCSKAITFVKLEAVDVYSIASQESRNTKQKNPQHIYN